MIRARKYKTKEIVEINNRNVEMLEIAPNYERGKIKKYNAEFNEREWVAQGDIHKVCTKMLKDLDKYADLNGFVSTVYIKSLINTRLLK